MNGSSVNFKIHFLLHVKSLFNFLIAKIARDKYSTKAIDRQMQVAYFDNPKTIKNKNNTN